MTGRTNAGGGGGGLNFEVVGSTTAPSNPKENTIWVNTGTAISSWEFSATQPAGAAGMVWFPTGASSIVEFNALKKNSMQICPGSAMQYVSGLWENKTTKIYQNGEWVDFWDGVLLGNGKNLLGDPTMTNENNVGSRSFTENADGSYTFSVKSSSGWAMVKFDFPNVIKKQGFSKIRLTASYSESSSGSAANLRLLHPTSGDSLGDFAFTNNVTKSTDEIELTADEFIIRVAVNPNSSDTAKLTVHELTLA